MCKYIRPNLNAICIQFFATVSPYLLCLFICFLTNCFFIFALINIEKATSNSRRGVRVNSMGASEKKLLLKFLTSFLSRSSKMVLDQLYKDYKIIMFS